VGAVYPEVSRDAMARTAEEGIQIRSDIVTDYEVTDD
jgi:hypothetical protein